MRPADPDVSPQLLGLMGLLDLASEALWVCDLHGDLLYVNTSAARFLEATPEALRGQNVVTLGLCANGLPWERFLDTLRAAHDLSRPAAMRLPSGKMVDLVIRVRLVVVDGEALIHGACVDVTEMSQLGAQLSTQTNLHRFARDVANRLLPLTAVAARQQ